MIRGSKWSATAWIHTQPFRPEELLKEAHPPQTMWQCFDEDSSCKSWAESGECAKNIPYMVSERIYPGENPP